MGIVGLNKQRNIIGCLVAVLFGSVVFQFTTLKNIIYKVYKWQLVQPETVKGLVEIAILFLLFCLMVYFLKKTWLKVMVVIVSLVFLLFHGVLVPAVVCILYFESIISIGRSAYKSIFKKEINKSEYMIFFLLGILLWSLVSIICSLLGFGSFNDLRIVSLVLLLLSFTNGFNVPFVVHLFKKISMFEKREMLPTLFIFILVLIQFAKSNTLLVYEFDSIWYGLRPEAVLIGNNSIFDNLGFVSFVHAYPKLFELYLIPVSNLGSYSYILSVNVLFYALIMYTVYLFFINLKCNRFTSLFFTCLIGCIPVLSNMGSTAKTDLFSTFLLVLGIQYLWRWIENFNEPGKGKGSDYLWIAAIALVLSMGGKPTSMLYVPFILFGAFIYMIINRNEFKNKSLIKEIGFTRKRLALFISSLMVFLGVCYRTYKITGVPTYPVFGNIWSKLGFDVKYPFIIKNAGETSASFELKDIVSRWYHLLFDPQPYGHIIMLWIGNLSFLLFCLFILLNIFNIKRVSRNSYLIFVIPVCLTGIFYATFLPNGGDGNFYIVPLVLGLIGLLKYVSSLVFEYKKILFISLILFIPFQFVTMFISHPSWSYGISPLRAVNLTVNNTEEMRSKIFEFNGLSNIENYLKTTGNLERCIGIGDDYVLNQLSCRMETVNASATDYLGNSKIYSNPESFSEFITWANIKYIIIPNTPPGEDQPVYNLLDEIRRKGKMLGKVISDSNYDLVLIDPSFIPEGGAWFDGNIQFLDGWYDIEGNYRWINKVAKANIETGDSGKLQIYGTVPNEYAQITMEIYINDSLLATETLANGIFQLEYDLNKNEKMGMRIEIDNSFIPKEKGISSDMRELSIIINNITVH